MRPHPPMRYSPSIEEAEPWEGKRAADLRALMRDIRETTHRLTGHAHRSLHAKSHALLEGTLDVLPGLPRELAQGMFAEPRSYPVVLRLSSNRGDILDDDIGVPRGLAMKVIGVEGPRLPGARSAATQDFVLVNQPFFTEPDLRVFRRNIRIVDATTQTGLLWKKAVSAVLRPAVAAARALGRRAPTLTTMGGHPLTHPLGDAYLSQVPFRHGEYVAKYALVPVSPELRRLQDRRLDMRGRPNALRQACIAHFRRHGGVWELRAQLRTNPRTMPIENASAEWPEAESPYRTVARVTVPPQPAWNEARARLVDDGLAFNPWHGIEAHRPLGAINRARLVAYAESARFRAERNGCPIREPGRAPEWPADAPEVFGTAPGREGRRPRTPDARPGAWEPPMRPATPVVLAGLALGVALLAALP
ncbi:MAG: catalase family protein, partial [Acetobacteraceae bacterium]|nr:catalase family protein [Acetobacteraceae bacterium]